MKLISSHELFHRPENELSAMFKQVSQGLHRTKRHTPERRNALASLENIAHARAHKLLLQAGL